MERRTSLQYPIRSDLWEYNVTASRWTWQGGSSLLTQFGNSYLDYGSTGSYGTQNVSAIPNQIGPLGVQRHGVAMDLAGWLKPIDSIRQLLPRLRFNRKLWNAERLCNHQSDRTFGSTTSRRRDGLGRVAQAY